MSHIGITNNYQQEYSMRGVRDLKLCVDFILAEN